MPVFEKPPPKATQEKPAAAVGKGVLPRKPVSSNPARELAAALVAEAGVPPRTWVHTSAADHAAAELALRSDAPDALVQSELRPAVGLSQQTAALSPSSPKTLDDTRPGDNARVAGATDVPSQEAIPADRVPTGEPAPMAAPPPELHVDIRMVQAPEVHILGHASLRTGALRGETAGEGRSERFPPTAPDANALTPDARDALSREVRPGQEVAAPPRTQNPVPLSQPASERRTPGPAVKAPEAGTDTGLGAVTPPPGQLLREAAAMAKRAEAELARARPFADPRGPEAGAVRKGEDASPSQAIPGAASAEVKVGPDQPTQPAAAVSRAPEPSDEVSAWRSKVGGAVQQIPKPVPPATARYTFTIKEASAGAALARHGAANKLSEDAKKAVAKAKEPQNPPAIEQDPSGSASKLVDSKSDRKLPDQKFPDLVDSPLGHKPEVGKRVVFNEEKGSVVEDTRVTELERRAQAGDPAAKKKLQELKAKAKEPLTPEDLKRRAEGVTLKDEGVPPPPEVPPIARVDTGEILARLLTAPQQYAEKSVEKARSRWLGGVLTKYPHVGKGLVEGELTFFKEELDRVREAASIKTEDLQKKIDARHAELTKQKTESVQALDAAHEDAKKQTVDSGQSYLDRVVGIRESIDRQIDSKVAGAKSGVELEELKRRRDTYLDAISKKVARWVVQYDDNGKARKKALGKAAYDQIQAYEAAAQEDKDVLAAGPYTEEGLLKAQLPIDQWLKARKEAVGKAVVTFKKATDDTVTRYQDELRTAGHEARTVIRDWMDREAGRERSWLGKIIDMFLDWAKQARFESDAWAAQRARETNEALDQQKVMLASLRMKFGEELDEHERAELEGLNDEQKAVVEAYYRPGGGDSVQALAEGLAARIAGQRSPEIQKAFQGEILKSEDLALVRAVAEAENFDIMIDARVIRLRNAFETWKGTDEGDVFKGLSGLSPIGGHAVAMAYKAKYGEDLRKRLRSELDDWATTTNHDIDKANALLEGDPDKAAAVELDDAMEGTFFGTGWGTDREKIFEILEGKSPEQIAAIRKAYKAKYGRDLVEMMDSELDDGWSTAHDSQRMYALVRGDLEDARAIELDQQMRGNLWTLGLGTDRKGIEKVYDKIQKEVHAEGRQKGWSTARIRDEIARRHQAVDERFEARYGHDYKDKKKPGQSALMAAYHDELSDSELDLVVGLHEQDWKKVDAARIHIERMGWFYRDDEVINDSLQAQSKRDYQDFMRDELLLLDARQKRDRDLVRRGVLSEAEFRARWNREEIQKKKEALDLAARKYAKDRAPENFERLTQQYNVSYANKLWGGGDLHTTVVLSTQGAENLKARTLLEQKGWLSEEQEIDYAMLGPGTDEATIDEVLEGKSQRQVAAIAARWEKAHPGRNFYVEVLGEYSGREKFDVSEKLRGTPQTPHEMLAAAERRLAFEERSTNRWSREEVGLLKAEVARLRAEVARFDALEAENKTEWDPEWQEAFDKVSRRTAHVGEAVALHRQAVDTVTDAATTIVAAVVTVVAIAIAVIVTVATAGAGAPLIPAVASALTSGWVVLGTAAAVTLATMATKYALKGDAYGWEEFATDAGVGVVDALVARLTLGVGDKLMKAAFLAKMGGRGLMSRMFARGLAEAGEGVIQTIPGAMLGTALNDETYKGGNPLLNILTGTVAQLGPAAMLSGALGSLGGIAKPVRKAGAAPSFDLELLRGDLKERQKAWKLYQQQFPGRTRQDFLRELDEALLKKQQRAFDDAALQRQMRKELLEHLPPNQRKLFADVPIEVLSVEDFNALTRSASGNAVTLFRRGRPVVVVKAGTDLSRLGEEGLHLLQSRTPATRRLLSALDERVLSRWDQLSVEKQFELYRKKLLLEIDAHQKLIRSLEAKGTLKGDLGSVRAQLDRAEATLANLRRRLDEVDAITGADMSAMQKGRLEKPQYLDQPARLFSKGDPLLDPATAPALAPEVAKGWPRSVKNHATHGPMAEGRPVRSDRALETIERVEVAKVSESTFFDQPGVAKVYQVGPIWEENGRLYRLVEAEDSAGRIIGQREEILQENGVRWQQRGREAVGSGEAAELASRDQTTRLYDLAPIEGTGTPPRVWANADRSVVRLDTQSASGHGFDEVLIHFDKTTGEATIRQIEVKRYGRSLAFSEFTASTVNMPRNMARIAEAIPLLPPELRPMARKALFTQKMLIEIRVAPGTVLGDLKGDQSILRKIERVATLWRDLVQVGNLVVGHPALTAAERKRIFIWGDELRNALLKSGNSFVAAEKTIAKLEREVARIARKVDPTWKSKPVDVLPSPEVIDAGLIRLHDERMKAAARLGARPAAHALRPAEALDLTQGPYEHIAVGPESWGGSSIFRDARGRPVIVSTPVLTQGMVSADLDAVGDTLLQQLRYRLSSTDPATASVLLDTRFLQSGEDLKRVLQQVWKGSASEPTLRTRLTVMVDNMRFSQQELAQILASIGGPGGSKGRITPVGGALMVTFPGP